MIRWLLLAALALLLLAPRIAEARTLDDIRAARQMTCGTVASVEDWNGEQAHGNLARLGEQICVAVATAILGDAEGLAVRAYPAELEAMQALHAGDIQLAVGLSPSAEAAARLGIAFGRPVFLDTVRVLVPKSAGLTSVAGLRDRLVCAMNNAPPSIVFREEMDARQIPFALQAHSEQGEMNAAMAARYCAGVALESQLAEARAGFPANAGQAVFLPERFGLYPVVPAIRDGDPVFRLIVDYTTSALLEAESLGITQANVAAAMTRQDVRASRLLGRDFAVAQGLGLAHDWAAKVIAATGNYGEIFDHALAGPYRLERGPNALWTDGGLLYPLPMQ